MITRAGAAALIAIVSIASARAAEVTVLSSDDANLALAPVKLPSGAIANYSVGIGSGAFRHPADPANVIWTVGDRGPNMTCAEAEKLIGPEIRDNCRAVRNGRVYPTPDYAPSIYKVELDAAASRFKVVETIMVKTKSGKPVSGLLNPQTKATKDTGVDLAGRTLADNPDNVDLEAIVRLADGTFWIAEEMGPSIAELSADGRILRRFVPVDAVDDYKGSEAEIVGLFPALLSKRQGNRGFESLAISPDERFLYAIMQNPLANPNAQTYQDAKNARLFKFDRVSGRLVGEFVYQLDDPMSFGFDPSDKQNDPRISEILALGPDRLLVLERTEQTTKLYEIDLAAATNILGGPFDEAATRPTLEQKNDLSGTGVSPTVKTLRFDTFRDFKDAPQKIEGMALLGDGALLLINDNDFGIRGDKTQILIVRGAATADRAAYAR